MSIVLIDASVDSLTVSWPDLDTLNNRHQKSATTYQLQYRRSGNNDTVDSCVYETLSNSLHTTLVRKKNLLDPDQNGFIFRVRTSNPGTDHDNYTMDGAWMTHAEPFYLLTPEQMSKRMVEPPSVTYGGTNASLRISWKAPPSHHSTTTTNTVPPPSSSSYEIQMRENIGGTPWMTIASMYTTTEVRKKNVTSVYGYQFRVRPQYDGDVSSVYHTAATFKTAQDDPGGNTTSTSTTDAATVPIPFSPPSEPMIALSYSTNCMGLQRLLASLTNQTVLSNAHLLHNSTGSTRRNQNNKKGSSVAVPVAETLGGKEFILVYASAHWCGPCRQYTPKLIAWYQQQVTSATTSSPNHDRNESTMEIVFVSADHDEASFQSYYSTMPWTAIDYDDATREQLMSYIRVTGIPRLAVLDGRTGRIIEDNAVNKPLDVQRWRKLVSK